MMRCLFTLMIGLGLAASNIAYAGLHELPRALTADLLANVPLKLHQTIIALQEMPERTDLSGLQSLDRSVTIFPIALSSANPRISANAPRTATSARSATGSLDTL